MDEASTQAEEEEEPEPDEDEAVPADEPEEKAKKKRKKKKKSKKADDRLKAAGLKVAAESSKKTIKYMAYQRRLRDLEELPDDDVEALERIQQELSLLSPEEILIPQDLFTFFTAPGGHSMLVRGASKTGKTTIALQIVEEIAEVDELLYVPSRSPDRKRFIQFPWLLEKEEDDRVFLSNKKIAKKLGKEIDDGRVDLKDIRQLLRRSPNAQEIINIYARIQERIPNPTIIVFDRIDKLAERHRVDVGDLMELLHRDLANRAKAQLIFVQEQSRLRGLDSLVDGCMVLKTFSEDEQDFTGHMELTKLLGIDLQQPRFFYKVKGGRLSFMRGVKSF
jgi:KaiC/GvpD/RAD55 family RecA-like ATPase